MYKYILGIDGMRCGMCESHVQETLMKSIKLKKVKASHSKNVAVVISEESLNLEDFKKVLDPTGYRILSFSKTSAVKTFLGWK